MARPAPIRLGAVSCTVVRGPRADGRWYWRARSGEVTHWTGWATSAEAEVAVAQLVSGHGATPADVGTVRDLLAYWLGDQEERAASGELAPASLATMTSAARSLVAGLGPVRLEGVTAETLERYRDRRLRPGPGPSARLEGQRGRLPRLGGMAPETVARELRLLRTAWTWGHERGLVARPTLPRVRVRVRPVTDRYTPTPAEVAAVLEHLDGWPWLAVRLLEATGCRLGEIGTLTRADIDGARAVLHVTGKTGQRPVAILPDVLAELLPLMAKRGPVLGITPESLRTALRRHLAEACTAAGCPRWTAHGLRRLAVDRLYRAGVDVGTAAAHLGHSPAVALEHYRRASAADMADAVARAGLGRLPDGDGVVLPLVRRHRDGTG